MYKTSKQEEFSRAYVCALSALLGFNATKPNVDNDSIDLYVTAKYPITCMRRSPQIDLQLKCTMTSFSEDAALHFPLPIKNYEDLQGSNIANPRYLVVLCVPELEESWIEMKQEEMILRYSAYWFSLRNTPAIKNRKTVTIKIPKSQKLDKESFKLLMDKASEGLAL
jgi:hypothetical protein